jgi:hypothetical protein
MIAMLTALEANTRGAAWDRKGFVDDGIKAARKGI